MGATNSGSSTYTSCPSIMLNSRSHRPSWPSCKLSFPVGNFNCSGCTTTRSSGTRDGDRHWSRSHEALAPPLSAHHTLQRQVRRHRVVQLVSAWPYEVRHRAPGEGTRMRRRIIIRLGSGTTYAACAPRGTSSHSAAGPTATRRP
jgi:hypothetical protein